MKTFNKLSVLMMAFVAACMSSLSSVYADVAMPEPADVITESPVLMIVIAAAVIVLIVLVARIVLKKIKK